MWLSDGWTVTKRNLTKLKRSPDMLIFAVLQRQIVRGLTVGAIKG